MPPCKWQQFPAAAGGTDITSLASRSYSEKTASKLPSPACSSKYFWRNRVDDPGTPAIFLVSTKRSAPNAWAYRINNSIAFCLATPAAPSSMALSSSARIITARLAALFDVPQTRIEHFFHASELCTPQIAHVVKALVDPIKS